MVLVDTSVWIRFLANRAPYAPELDRLLSLDEVIGHELVYGEFLIGDRGGRKKLLAAYEQMHRAAIVPHRDIVAFARDRDRAGAVSAGSTFTYLRPRLSGDCSCGQMTHDLTL
jgi:predicted nucleic acid-binding protein